MSRDLIDLVAGLENEPSIVATKTLESGEFIKIRFYNGHEVKLTSSDGWLIIEGDSTLTVRPVNEREIYVRPVGYVGAWIPEFAAKPLGVHREESVRRIKQAKRRRQRLVPRPARGRSR